CFFQAEDGIRDRNVTGVQTWLFRSLLRKTDGFGLVGGKHIDDAVGGVVRDRADVLGTEPSEASAFDHCRASHADVRIGRGDYERSEERRVGRERRARWAETRRKRRG